MGGAGRQSSEDLFHIPQAPFKQHTAVPGCQVWEEGRGSGALSLADSAQLHQYNPPLPLPHPLGVSGVLRWFRLNAPFELTACRERQQGFAGASLPCSVKWPSPATLHVSLQLSQPSHPLSLTLSLSLERLSFLPSLL